MHHTLVLQHVAVEGPAALLPALQRHGNVTVLQVFAGQPVPRVLDADALVVLGGPMGVGDQMRLPHLRDELNLIERTVASERPILGICLGSQLLAAALGARVRPSGGFELGWSPVTRLDPEDGVLGPPASSFLALHWHGDIFDLPQGATSLGRSARTECQAFSFGRALGLLFHLEADLAQVSDMATAFSDDLGRGRASAQGLIADTSLHSAAAHARLRSIVDAWLAAR